MDHGTVRSADIKNMSLTELDDYCRFLRERIIEITERNGGHLASNLGVVELTVALHYVFDMPTDKVIWDVGHQTYAHKLLTGRGELMERLRHDGGASGFPSSRESEFDAFITGHSGTSLSMALGLARARDLRGGSERTVAVIGDGAFTSGEIYEALNDLGDRPTRLIIILNDNKMSISRNVGAMSKYFGKLRVNKKFVDLKSDLRADLYGLPFVGKPLVKLATGAKNKFKETFMGNKFFEHFGLKYYGPYDGHSLEELISALEHVKDADRPVIVHLLTKKGKGLAEAELHPEAYHGVPPSGTNGRLSMSRAAGETLCELAETENMAVVTAAMADGLCFDKFARLYPKRFFDVAIAEQHAVSLCAGLARGGVRPFFGVYSTFLQRAFDQVLHDVCINHLPVTFLIDRAGAVGADGVTHQGVFDLSYLSLIPGLTILSPKDGAELAALIRYSLTIDGPVAIRYFKSYDLENECRGDIGRWEISARSDSGVTVLAVGRANEVARRVSNATIVNARVVKPLDKRFLDELDGTVITLEDNVLRGGFGSAVSAELYGRCKVVSLGYKDEFIDVRDEAKSLELCGITVANVQNLVNKEALLLEKTHKR